jgi:hypothetical protein
MRAEKRRRHRSPWRQPLFEDLHGGGIAHYLKDAAPTDAYSRFRVTQDSRARLTVRDIFIGFCFATHRSPAALSGFRMARQRSLKYSAISEHMLFLSSPVVAFAHDGETLIRNIDRCYWPEPALPIRSLP